jgi:RNA polymerase sigma factor (sigma-70 family)
MEVPLPGASKQARRSAIGELGLELNNLLELHRAGDPSALNMLVKRLYPLVRSIVYRLVGPRSPEAHDDLVQASIEQFCLALDSFRGDAALTSFIYGVCHRTIGRVTRYERVRHWFRQDAREICIPSEVAPPDEQLERRRLIGRARAALDQLSLDERTVFVPHQAEGLLIDDIATALSCSTRTVKRRLQSARLKLLRVEGVAS